MKKAITKQLSVMEVLASAGVWISMEMRLLALGSKGQ
ncbi:hypothetical protein E2320_015405 [Naja naja]|nr:hypothetical protein E2320_015405 [Naja naja]